MVRRAASILLLMLWLGLGSGLLAQLHRVEQDAAAGGRHDESHCQLYAQLHSPAMPAEFPATVAGYVLAGDSAPRASQCHTDIAELLAFSSRGPPAL